MRKAAVIGWPIAHSRSPLIHGSWLAEHGIAGSYERIAVPPGEAGQFVRSLAERGLVGVNVTIPHKLDVLAAADEPEESARLAGAANLVWHEGGRIRCANTDGSGFLAHLDLMAPQWRAGERRVMLLGAGGGARALSYAFIAAGAQSVTLVNRTPAAAERIVADLSDAAYRQRVRLQVSAWDDRSRIVSDRDVIVNTTSVGMKDIGSLGLDLAHAHPRTVVADIVYVPLETGLLADAKARGLTIVDGLGMLLHQAVPAFERFFGVRPTVTPELRARIVSDIMGR